MFTGTITPERLRKSVLSVPALARNADLSLNVAANQALVEHMRAAGVSTFMYGGNANFHNVGVEEYPAIVDLPEALAGPDDTGPMPPFLSNIEDPARLRLIAGAAIGLRALNDNPAKLAAA